MERTDNDTWDLVIGVGATATLVATATNAENPLNDDPFTECTVFADIDNLPAIARDEMFGPVVTITSYAETMTPSGSQAAAPTGRREPSRRPPHPRHHPAAFPTPNGERMWPGGSKSAPSASITICRTAIHRHQRSRPAASVCSTARSR